MVPTSSVPRFDISAILPSSGTSVYSDMINTLSGRTDLCIMVDQIRKEYGDDSSKWLPIYFDKLHQM